MASKAKSVKTAAPDSGKTAVRLEDGVVREGAGSFEARGGEVRGRSNRVEEADAVRAQIEVLERKWAVLGAGTRPRMILPELRDPESGRMDAQRVAEFMGVPL